MVATQPRRGQQLLVQGIATAVTALLIAGGAAWGAGAPADDATTQAAATEAGPDGESLRPQDAEDDVKPAKTPKPEKEAKTEQRKSPKAKKASGPKSRGANGKALGQGNGQGNGQGKRVSAAARGETPPVGDCRNHGHWVSTVAKGLNSCNDNPRPAADTDD